MTVTYDKTGISVSIETDNKEVIANGSVFSIGDSISFFVENLELKLEFYQDKKKDKETYAEQVVEDNRMRLQLYNFDGPLGSGLTEPIQLGYLNNREYFFIFETSKGKNATSRKIEYTFYLGQERIDGENE